MLLEGNRVAVAGFLLAFVYTSLMVIGTVWSFEMQQILTETSTVENILETFLSGIILLVSIVVSINSIVLSQDMASVERQETRIRGVGDFWRDIDELTDTRESPSDIESFLEVMTTVIREHTEALAAPTGETDDDFDERIGEYTEFLTGTVDHLDEANEVGGADFARLWTALSLDYGPLLDRTHAMHSRGEDATSQAHADTLDSLVDAFRLFAVGREYFKTMYYTAEVSRLSRVLLIASLPAILLTASAILAVSSGVIPDLWVLGLPPKHSFVATAFAIALVPYLVFTSFMLRLSTVAKATNTGGLISMH